MARSFVRNILNKSHVSNEEYTGEGNGLDPLTLDNTLQMNAALEQMDAEHADAEAIAAEVDELDTNQAKYTDAANMIEEMGDNGGISVEAAQILAFFCQQDGFDAPTTVSVEAFGGGRSVSQSRVACEGLRETVKGWWAKLKEWLKKLSTKIKKWWETNWAAAPRLAARAEALRKSASGKSTSPKEKKFENEGLYKALAKKQGFNPSLASDLKVVNDLATAAFGSIQQKTISHVENMSNFIGDLDFSDESKFESVKSKFAEGAAEAPFKDLPTELKMTVANGSDFPEFVANTDASFTVYATQEFPGSKAFYATLPKTLIGNGTAASGDTVGKFLRSIADNYYRFEITCADFTKKELDGSGKQLPIAGRMEITSICDEVINIAKTIENYKKNFENQGRARDQLEKAGDRLSNTVSSADDKMPDAGTAVSALNSVITACNKMLSEPARTFTTYIMKTANAAISYGEASLSKYEK